MAQFLVAIHHPDGYDGSLEGEAMVRDIHALNQEMQAAGVRIFAGGLTAARDAKSLRAQPSGKVLITDGPYLAAMAKKELPAMEPEAMCYMLSKQGYGGDSTPTGFPTSCFSIRTPTPQSGERTCRVPPSLV
jgi:hypothetical protein